MSGILLLVTISAGDLQIEKYFLTARQARLRGTVSEIIKKQSDLLYFTPEFDNQGTPPPTKNGIPDENNVAVERYRKICYEHNIDLNEQ